MHAEGVRNIEYSDEVAGDGLSTIIRAEVFIVLIVWGTIIGMVVWYYAFQARSDSGRRWGEQVDLLPSWAPHGMQQQQQQQGSPSKDRALWNWQPVMRGLSRNGHMGGLGGGDGGGRAQRPYGAYGGAPPSRMATPEPRMWAAQQHQQQLSARQGYPMGGVVGASGFSARQGFGGFPGSDGDLSSTGPGRPPGMRAGAGYSSGYHGGDAGMYGAAAGGMMGGGGIMAQQAGRMSSVSSWVS